MIKRAALVIGEAMSCGDKVDTIVTARRALEAAIRNERDVDTLVPKMSEAQIAGIAKRQEKQRATWAAKRSLSEAAA
jgi:hypothetical protein